MRNVPVSCLARPPKKRASGFSLVELLLVVGLLALIAALAVPAFNDDDEASLDQAALRIAQAFRFAQAEAVRTGKAHGVHADFFAQRIRVYWLDNSTSPATIVYDIRDPFSKQPYSLNFNAGGSAPSITSIYFKFKDVFFPVPYLGFAAETGAPKYTSGSSTHMLETAHVQISLGGETRTISVSPVTGRVTVQ